MNIDKDSAANTHAPLAPADWTMVLQREGSQFTAEVARSRTVLCRLSAIGAPRDEFAVRRALADKARWWIREYMGRHR